MKILRSPFFSFLVCLWFLNCNTDTTPVHKVFKLNLSTQLTSLDPAFAKNLNNIWAVQQVFNGLVELDENLGIRPSIAKRWVVSENGLEYTFILRDDVFFHKDDCFKEGTRRVVAEDVVYSLSRLIDPELASPGAWLFNGKVAEDTPFLAIDDTTFVMKLKSPFLPMLGILSMQYCSIVPEEAVLHYGDDFRAHPIGTGPFKFKRWIENQALFLSRNDTYFKEGLPHLEGVKIQFIPDKKIAFLELLNGKLDYVKGLESSFINELLTRDGALQDDKKSILQYRKSPYLNMEYIGINLEACPPDSPLRKKKVRQALNYGLDRSLMLSALRNNVGKAADAGFIPRGLPAHDPKQVSGFSYSPKKAAELMAEAGYPGGEGMPLITIFTNKDYLDLTTYAVKQWERIGFKIKIDVMENALLRDGMRKSQIPFFRASWIADYPEAENFLCVFYGDNPAPPNYTRFSNQAFNQLYEKSVEEVNDSIRYNMYQEMDKILLEEAPVVFLFYDETANFYSARVQNISNDAINNLRLENVEIDLNKSNN